MKQYFIPLLAISLLSTVSAQETLTDQDKLNYAFGYTLGKNFKSQGIEIDVDMLVKGLKGALSDEAKVLLNEQEMSAVLDKFRKEQMAKQMAASQALAEKRQKSAKENLKEGKAFLAENKTKKGVVTLPSGLQYKVMKQGTGKIPKSKDKVKVHYRGTLIDGTEFDSSHNRGKPVTFTAKGVIKGWTEALLLMKEGAKWQIFIPSDLAYGDLGAGKKIGPNATLIFEVELISIEE